MNKQLLKTTLCPPNDPVLIEQLLNEYNSIISRYILRDWEPATLDGGQFAEASARILYHQDSGNLNYTKSVDTCLAYIEDLNNSNTHNFPERKSALHLAKVIRTIYKFRSDRGAIHINPQYSANQLDATLVLSNTKWVLGELLRIFLTSDLNLVESIIRDILEFNIPVVGDYDGLLIVQRTDCNTDEEILILLHYTGPNGISRSEIGQFVQKSPSAITTSLKKLSSGHQRKIIRLKSGNYRLTGSGSKYVTTILANKLTLE